MNQDKIWRFFQTEASEVMRNAEGRLKYLARQVRRRTKKGAKVLNVGVGAALFEETAIKLGLDVYSLDPDDETIARLTKRTGMEGRAMTGTLQSIPFDAEAFQAVVVSEVLEHLSDEAIEKALSEIHRVLLRGGFVMGTVPARENLLEQLAVCPHCGEKFHRWGHLQSFDEARLKAMLSGYFEVEAIEEKHLDSWSQLNWKGKALSLVKQSLLAVGVSGSGNSLYFSATKNNQTG
ncbi:MAG: class I SAM-dependent methyltransferase [Pyrinomonadaceae bacterium]|nr:class I SAM-dependent methyltransferase [Pyrinomonadaceae bacterium]